MSINRNSNPYYDDFDAKKNFHQILFRPGFSVQARELTQLQSILRNQIATFGGHVFQDGSVVIPGNSNSDLNICYVKLQATTYDVTSLEGKTVTGGTTGLVGYIRKGIAADDTDPATIYVSYYNSGLAGEKVFNDGEILTISGVVPTFLSAASAACGGASMAFINKGVFFVRGTFVTCLSQSIVIGKYTSSPSCHVLLQISESIVNADEDNTLLDPAQGSYNYAAPGADRLKISLDFTTLALGSAITDDFIEIMRYNEGVLEEQLRYPKYNELAKQMARRTYDESGDYVVSGLNVKVREHLKDDINGGRYPASAGGDASKLIYTISPGKAYIHGFENEIIAPYEMVVDKARGSEHVKTAEVNLIPSFGQYFYASNFVNLPTFEERETVDLVDSWPAGATVIGTAQVLAIEYVESNSTDSNAIYKVFVSDVTINPGSDVSQVGGMNFTGGSCKVLTKMFVITTNSTEFVLDETVTFTTRVAKVHKWTRSTGTLYVYKGTTAVEVPVIGDNIVSAGGAIAKVNDLDNLVRNKNDNLLIPIPVSSVASVKNESNVSDISYKASYETLVTITGGNGSFSVTGMTIDPASIDSIIIVGASGVYPHTVATVAVDGLSCSFTGISPSSTTLHVIATVTKEGASNGAPKTKTLNLAFTESGLTSSSTVQLIKADGVRLQSVEDSIDGIVTDRYTFDGGQRDYAYLRSIISLIPGKTLPTGTLTVIYDYFAHNPGDYFSIDSYVASGLADYYESPILNYKSKNTGKTYNLRALLDFRPRIGEDGTYTGSGASLNTLIQPDTRLTSSVQHYVGRIDALTYNKGGQFSVISGIPDDNPKNPVVPEEALYLAKITVPAYTFKASSVKVEKQNNRVYTMRDVGVIDKRLSNLEDTVLLNETESSAVNYDVLDAKTGLSRYKSGYLVDNFKNPDVIADIYNPQFRVAYDSGNIVPQFEVIESSLTMVGNTGQQTNGCVTMPYTHVALAQQPVSSKITNVNPFAVFSWTGEMTLVPSSDTWTQVENLPSIINNITETVNIQAPWTWAPPISTNVSFPPAPMIVSPINDSDPGVNGTDAQSGAGLGGGDGAGDKIVCTAMNEAYGFGSFRNNVWLMYSARHMSKAHEVGYHALFLPLVDYGFKRGDGFANLVLRRVLEHVARRRTKDIRAEMRGLKRDAIGRTYRAFLEPLCFVVGSVVLNNRKDQ